MPSVTWVGLKIRFYFLSLICVVWSHNFNLVDLIYGIFYNKNCKNASRFIIIYCFSIALNCSLQIVRAELSARIARAKLFNYELFYNNFIYMLDSMFLLNCGCISIKLGFAYKETEFKSTFSTSERDLRARVLPWPEVVRLRRFRYAVLITAVKSYR